jgi:hypothetical protein
MPYSVPSTILRAKNVFASICVSKLSLRELVNEQNVEGARACLSESLGGLPVTRSVALAQDKNILGINEYQREVQSHIIQRKAKRTAEHCSLATQKRRWRPWK